MNTSILQRQVTQFDTTRTQASIATPTCSSCCCCCCCLGTAVAASVGLAIDVDKNAPKKTPKAIKSQAKTYAAIAVPATVLFWILANMTFPELANNLISLGFIAIAILLLPLFGMILLAYHTAAIPTAGGRAISAIAIIAGCVLVEGYLGMMLIFMGMPGLLIYLIGATVIAIAIPLAMQPKKKKKSRKDTSNYDTW